MKGNCFIILVMSFVGYCVRPRNKREHETWRVECEFGLISDPDCPVDGGWTPWGAWSPCYGSCDMMGYRKRTRKCNNPPTKNDGTLCSGPDEEIKNCYITNCTVADYKTRIQKDIARMKAFHQLETVPAILDYCLLNDCSFGEIEGALATDNTWQLTSETLWIALLCVKFNVGCEVQGAWGSWGPWSHCGARCGHGYRWRLRRCDSPPASTSYLVCNGVPVQSKPCVGNQCAVDVSFVSKLGGVWGDWGSWSTCSETCGVGVQRRRRKCNEKRDALDVTNWDTHCTGAHDQITICQNNICNMDGGWTGWGPWSACSCTCGAGVRTKSRSCTRPASAGEGSPCIGLRTESGSCYLTPCEVFSHVIAAIHGESQLEYNFDKRRSTLFHFYLRFKSVSPHGTLVRRGSNPNPLVLVTLQNWHVCVDANGNGLTCSLPRICVPSALEPDTWHSVLVTVSSESVTLRIDNSQGPIKSSFPCDPKLPNAKMNIIVGEKLHGEIQEIILNFMPLKLEMQEHKSALSDFYPSATSNIAYEKANIDEAYLHLDNNEFLSVPCFDEQNSWLLELTLMPQVLTGTLIFMFQKDMTNWLHVSLQNMRLTLRLAVGELRSESISYSELPPNQWFDLVLSSKETNTIEIILNSREKLHVGVPFSNSTCFQNNIQFVQNISQEPEEKYKPPYMITNNTIEICDDELYLGGVPDYVDSAIDDDLTPFSGIVASVRINLVLQDLHAFSVERSKNGQISSRTASVSGLYYETGWGKSNQLNLTCLYAKTMKSPYQAQWLYLDVSIDTDAVRKNELRFFDDGRMLRLVATADNELRGFYTCRAHCSKRRWNIVTYGILGSVQYVQPGPDLINGLAIVTTLALVFGTLIFLLTESIRDLRNGYGFFRDRVLKDPQEEAVVICSYIDSNLHMYSSPKAAQAAKARARRKGKQTSRMNFGAQEPEGIKKIEQQYSSSKTTFSELDTLPALSPVTGAADHTTYAYTSSIDSMSDNEKGNTSFSCELPNTPIICQRLQISKNIFSPKGSVFFKRTKQHKKSASRKIQLTIESHVNLTPGQKVLERFRQLQDDDLQV